MHILYSILVAVAATMTATAGTIHSVAGSIGPGTVSATFNTVSAGNDNTTGASPNTVDVIKSFTSIGTMPLAFRISPGATTEYYFTETVTNNTTLPWIGYRIVLVPPTHVDGPIAFVPTVFDAGQDPSPTSSAFASLVTSNSSLIEWSLGTVNPGDTITFSFSVDVGQAFAGFSNLPAFGIYQTPVVAPEPGSMGLAAAGLAALMLRRRIGLLFRRTT